MPLTGSGLVLGAAISGAGGVLGPGIAKCGSLGQAMAAWVVANASVTNIPPAGTLTAAGTAVSGAGRLSFSADADSFGDALAASIPAVDPPAIAKWRALATGIRQHIIDNGRANPTSFVAVATGGPVTGTGKVSFTSMVFAPTLASRLALTDAANVAVWLAIGSAILSHIAANAVVGPGGATGFSSPTGGGILTGVSVIT